MRAGQIDRRIVIERNTTTDDSLGEPIDSWATLATVWAEVREPRGREFFAGGQRVAEVDTVFIIRHRTDVTAKDRINYDSKLYDIQFIGEIGRTVGLEIMAKAQGL